MKRKFALLVVMLVAYVCQAQVVTPFSIRYQTTQKGGIVYLANVAVSCTGNPGSGSGACQTAAKEVAPNGTGVNNDFNQVYVDIDNDPTTFQSSSDSLALPNCSNITWAGLYWGAMGNASTTPTRNNIKIKVNNGAYQNISADASMLNTTGYTSYHNFKDITNIVKAAGTNARFTVANIPFVNNGSSNNWGSWSIVVVYGNQLQNMRQLTVFDGLANVSGSNVVSVPISGFLTPPTGPVNFELGTYVHDGDRDYTGDQMLFSGNGGAFVNVSDALNPVNDVFNSTVSNKGVMTSFRNPNMGNTMGLDADIFQPDNSAKSYLGNSFTSATLRLTTGGETYLVQEISTAIDVYEPDLRVDKKVFDKNGNNAFNSTINPGDTLTYRVTVYNIGSDTAINTYVSDSLTELATLVPNSIRYVFGPNSGSKTDAAGDDQAEYTSNNRKLRFRIGRTASALSGGRVGNNSSGSDSTVITYKITASNDCYLLKCDNKIENRAYATFTGKISGNTNTNGSNPAAFDVNGCPISGSTDTYINVSLASCSFPSDTAVSVCANSIPDFSTIYTRSGYNLFLNSSYQIVTAPTTSGIYYAVHNTSTSCSDTVAITVTVNAPNAGSDITGVCAGALVSLSGTNPTSGTWSALATNPTGSTLGSTVAGNVTASFSNSASGTYQYLYTAAGCTDTMNVMVIAKPTTPVATLVQPTCTTATGSITVTSPTGPGLTYSIDGTNYQASTTFSAVASGTYNIVVKNANGCTSAASTVTINTQPSTASAATVSLVQPTCTVATGTINVTAPTGAGLTYSIDGTTYQAGTSFTSVTAGTYNVTVRNASGCTSTATVATINAQPSTASAATVSLVQPTCTVATGTINVTAPTGAGLTYSIDGTTYQAGTSFTAVAAGTYNVTVRNATGCISTATAATINAQPSTPSAATVTVTQPSCTVSTGTINITAPTGAGLTYSINGTTYQAGSSFSALSPASYNVTVRNASGCTSTTTVATINAQPSTPSAATVNVTQPTCTVATGAINITAPTGAGLTYSIDGTTYQASTSFTAVPAGTYNVTIRNASGCTSTASASTINAQPSTPSAATVSVTQPTCTVSTGAINITAPIGAGLTYSIDGTTYQAGTTFSALPAATYNVTVRNATGCTSTATVATINTQPSTPTQPTIAASGSTTICNGGSVVLASSVNAAYQWYLNGTLIAGATQQTYTATASGNYTVVVTNASNCSSVASAPVQVSVQALPSPVITASSNTICSGSFSLLTSTSAATYQWFLNGTAIAGANQQTYNTNVAGNYTVQVSNASGCTASSTSFVLADGRTFPTIQVTGGGSGCNGGAQLLTASNGQSYQWYKNGVIITGATSQTYLAAQTGSYTCVVTNTNGCAEETAATQVQIVSIGNIAIEADASTTLCVNGKVRLCPATWGWSNYQWYKNGVAIALPDGGASCITLDSNAVGTYQLAASNGAGCWTDLSDSVVVKYDNSCNAGNGNGKLCSAGWFSVPATNNCDSTIQFMASGNNPSPISFNWNFGDGQTGSGSTVTHKYNQSGPFLVKLQVTNAQCTDSLSYTIWVSDCSVSGGAGAGVESKSLGETIAILEYNRAIQSKPVQTEYVAADIVHPSTKQVFGNTANLSDLLPNQLSVQQVLNSPVMVYNTTPTQLLNYTNATEVSAQDYVLNGITRAASFVTKTVSSVYGHTKPVCDRLKEAELMQISREKLNGFDVIFYHIKKDNGVQEYAASFNVGKNASNAVAQFQSLWLNDEYVGYDTMYNFQVWSCNLSLTKNMVKDVLSKLTTAQALVQSGSPKLPAVYVRSIARNGKQIEMQVVNTTSATKATVYIQPTATELSKEGALITKQINILPFAKTNVVIPFDDRYETIIKLATAQANQDAVYTNDGAWSIDYQKASTSVQQYTITQDNKVSDNTEWRLNRNVQVKASTKDYITIYKLLKAGALPKNMSDYKGIRFECNAEGAQQIKVTLVKSSIVNWDNQFSVLLPVSSDNAGNYQVSFADFKSKLNNVILQANDITNIVFSFINTSGKTVNMQVNIGNVRFTKTDDKFIASLSNKQVQVYPNPNKGNFTVQFTSETNDKHQLQIFDLVTGKLVVNQMVESTVGVNKVNMALPTEKIIAGNYVVFVSNAQSKYVPCKFTIVK